MTDATVTEIAQWYAASQEASAAFLRMMRLRLADAPDRAEALYVAHRLAPEDVTAEELAAMWLVTAADLIDARDELERLKAPTSAVEAARALESAAIRRYADRYHSFAGSHPGTSGPGEPLDPDAWCLCGSSWSEEDGGCVERKALLEEAAVIDRDYRGEAVGGDV